MPSIKIEKFKNMTDLEREAINAKFREKPGNKHRAVFCRDTRSLVIAASYSTPLRSTQLAIQGMINLYAPSMVIITSMPRMPA